MAKKRTRTTPEEHARQLENQRRLREIVDRRLAEEAAAREGRNAEPRRESA